MKVGHIDYNVDGPTHNFQWALWRAVRDKRESAAIHIEVSHGGWPGVRGALESYFREKGLRPRARPGARYVFRRASQVCLFLVLHCPDRAVRLAAVEYARTWHHRLLVRGVVVSLDLKIATERAAAALWDVIPRVTDGRRKD